MGTYQQLVEWFQKGDLSFAEVRSVNLDEYLGLSPPIMSRATAISCRPTCLTISISSRKIPMCSTDWPKDPAVECAAYNKLIRDLGGIDLQLLGMGRNGHIAFNEPGTTSAWRPTWSA